MSEFEEYIKNLAVHEVKKSVNRLTPRELISMAGGSRLNWLGYFLSNENITWEKFELPIDQILFTGTSPEWNEVLINRSKKQPSLFKLLIEEDSVLKAKFASQASYGTEPILVRPDEGGSGKYKMLDGSHRLIGAILSGKENITAFYPINADKFLPLIEPHVIYDFIVAYQIRANDEQSRTELIGALRFLIRTYANARDLLIERFDISHVASDDVQLVVKEVLETQN